MPVQLVLIGLPQSGKTTVFNALTRAKAVTGGFSGAGDEPNLATVKVPDPRLDVLTRMFNPRRTVPAEVQYYDVAGLAKGVHERGLSGRLLGYLSQADALVHVVRAFDDPAVPHPEGSVDPLRDVETIDLELAFSDLSIIEKRLARIQSMLGKLRAAEREAQEREAELLGRLQDALTEGTPIREVELSAEEAKALRGFGFLTAKPLLILLNFGEELLGEPAERLLAEVSSRYRRPGVAVDALPGKLEEEIAQLQDDDARDFMDELGIEEPGRDRVIRLSYALLGLISFFTVGPDEVRAWTIRRGTTAVEAAGTIHSDLQQGFIRAEVVSYDDLVRTGSLAEARRAGVLRLEGKQYVVQDGDVLHILFNV
ncbi:redox-regulated ATPase YchF [Thermomicrobiaceae bacterium CFH 74404]|uniref:Ribosome-binding ATPase YchF n=1 Tax=Thermalbibacter longus TaxID=2951981 RepID=A0AA41W9J0_9BACT|nr:redox-regulated ATPase YchF [Thermalbibacter longus]MCM8747566.1 redox-regulated ATPase YchF [Thermalbibacter longus]